MMDGDAKSGTARMSHAAGDAAVGCDQGGPSMSELRRSYKPMVRAVLRSAVLLAPEAFVELTPKDYAGDPAAIRRLADLVGSLAAIHVVAARRGSAVMTPPRVA